MQEFNGKHMHCLHDVANQHLQALTATKQERNECFTILVLELKLDQATMYDRQRHSQDSKDVSHYSALLDFIKLRAQASENAIHESDLKRRTHAAKEKCYLKISS